MDLRKEVFDINDIKMENVDLSEFGGPAEGFYVKTISSVESQRISKESFVLKEGVALEDARPEDYEMDEDFSYKLIVKCACDKDGNAIFESSDIHALKLKSKALIEKITESVNTLNGFSEKKIDEAEKK